jgi:hypothetical protein
MKNKNVLARSSRMKSIGLNNTSLQSSSYTLNSSATSTQGIQLVPGVTCGDDCSINKSILSVYYPFLKLKLPTPSVAFPSDRIFSYVGPLNSVFENIKKLNLNGFFYEPINITYTGVRERTYYEYEFSSPSDQEKFIKMIDTVGRHVEETYGGPKNDELISTKVTEEGLFPDGMLLKKTERFPRNSSSSISYYIRGDYFALQLCSASTSYAGPVIC